MVVLLHGTRKARSLEQEQTQRRVLVTGARNGSWRAPAPSVPWANLRPRKRRRGCQRPPALPFGLPSAGYLARSIPSRFRCGNLLGQMLYK